MNVPKQSIPVMRILPSISYSSQFGVNPSMRLDDIVRAVKRLFNIPEPSPGTCSCRAAETVLGGLEHFPVKNRCNPGFAPQCDGNLGCFCVDSPLVENSGRVVT
jgi:hypothetical protein